MDRPLVEKKHDEQEEREFIQMETSLQTLLNEGLLTKVEYRIIVPIRQLAARKTALYDIITSKYKQDPIKVMEMLKTLTSGMQEEADLSTELVNFNSNQELNEYPVNAASKNPLLINTVIHAVLEHLPLNEIKKFRLINHEWNTTAEPFLRKRGVIHFKPAKLKPSEFIENCKYSLPNLPFTEFKFSSPRNKFWRSPDIQEFFDKWGHNIKKVEFGERFFIPYAQIDDINSWLEKATNLRKLIVESRGTRIDLDKLRIVESIDLKYCRISTKNYGQDLRTAPREIILKNIDFEKMYDLSGNQICLNDYIDFSHCFKIDIRNTHESMVAHFIRFDMSSDILNANSVYFDGISIQNWGGANGKVDSIFLSKIRLAERNNLEIKELTLQSGVIDMSIIPPTIEKLRFSDDTKIICNYSLQLMNLQFLCLDNICQSDFDVISRFAWCANLKEVELMGYTLGPALELKIGNIPKSVKKLKVRNVQLLPDCHKRQLDTLIFEGYNFKHVFNDVTLMLCNKKLTVDVLVISCLNVLNLNTSDIIRFVKSNMEKVKMFEKLVIGVGDVSLKLNRTFKGSDLSRYVDKESNYYQFKNMLGESITAEEFSAFRNCDSHQVKEN